MSDLCMYQFEDIVWDEFCRSDDHLVPLSDFETGNDHSILGDSHKKPRHAIANIMHNTKDRSAMRYINQGREQRGLSAVNDRRNPILEKDSWSQTPCGAFPSSSDSVLIKEASSVASEDTTLPSTEKKSSEFGANDSLLGDKTTAVDKSLSYPISDISYTGNDFDFSEDTGDKDSSDFLYYDLPEIETFEDVDRMFRSCDSTFGLGASKEDELGWLTSADNMEGSGDGLRSDFKIPCPEANIMEKVTRSHGSSRSYSINDSATKTTHVDHRDNSWTSEKPVSYMSFVNGPGVADRPEGLILKEQINEQKKEFNPQDRTLGKRKGPYFMNGGFSYMNTQPNEVLHIGSETISDQVLLQQKTPSPDSSHYLQNPLRYMHSDNSHVSGLTSVFPTLSPVKSETNDIAFPSPKDSSRGSNQLKSMESSQDPKFQINASSSGGREMLHSCQGSRSSVSSNLKKQSATLQAATSNPGLIGKQVNCYGDKVENHSDVEGVNLLIPGELGSSAIQESSTISSGMDDISLEAASFHQLQLVMEQLDLRTKICIRDSLYRLARSAEQRHNRANVHGGCAHEPDASGPFVADGTDNFMDMETDTNPIDRSIAHLLFHRPSESSAATPVGASLPFKSPNAVRGSMTSTPIMVESSAAVCEETASDIEKMSNG